MTWVIDVLVARLLCVSLANLLHDIALTWTAKNTRENMQIGRDRTSETPALTRDSSTPQAEDAEMKQWPDKMFNLRVKRERLTFDCYHVAEIKYI